MSRLVSEPVEEALETGRELAGRAAREAVRTFRADDSVDDAETVVDGDVSMRARTAGSRSRGRTRKPT
jgi:hypothetical protein